MNEGFIVFEVMDIKETFVTVKTVAKLNGVEMPSSRVVYCLQVGEMLSVPIKFDEVIN